MTEVFYSAALGAYAQCSPEKAEALKAMLDKQGIPSRVSNETRQETILSIESVDPTLKLLLNEENISYQLVAEKKRLHLTRIAVDEINLKKLAALLNDKKITYRVTSKAAPRALICVNMPHQSALRDALNELSL